MAPTSSTSLMISVSIKIACPWLDVLAIATVRDATKRKANAIGFCILDSKLYSKHPLLLSANSNPVTFGKEEGPSMSSWQTNNTRSLDVVKQIGPDFVDYSLFG
jgi:hypothetical protein